MTGNIDLLEEYSERSLPASIKIADGSLTTIKGSGSEHKLRGSYKEFQPVQTDISLQPILYLPITVSPKPASTIPVPSEGDGNNLNNSDELPSSLSQHSTETEGNDGYQEATIVDPDDFPISIRKGIRKCTDHPINKYVAYRKLQSNFRAFTASINSVKIPRNVIEAFQSLEWKKVVEGEIKTLEKNKTWSLTDLPE
ncbi:uncharacterized protein LOC120212176 [Hibiscus syriacus]|uniref:uncharacterized protein LOC120212176 n=1 Tax=Hibiscus syriacus TaxID=106335 RepID=UPI00192185DF|nr:uncharacterized protein LOC120212176 [Hibiscus syriacus]